MKQLSGGVHMKGVLPIPAVQRATAATLMLAGCGSMKESISDARTAADRAQAAADRAQAAASAASSQAQSANAAAQSRRLP